MINLMKSKISYIFFAIFIVIFIILTVISLFSIVTANNGRLPLIFGRASVQIMTQSMSPLYNPGDVLVIKKVNPDALAIDDVICFRSSDPNIYGQLNTHRIVEIKNADGKRVFVTKGDNNPRLDEYTVEPQDVMGIVVAKNTFFSKILSLFRSRFGFLFVIVIPLLFVLAGSIKQFAAAVVDYSNSKVGEDDSEHSKEI